MTKMSDKAIFLDRDFNKMIDDNAQAAWLEYCKINGLDPDKEEIEFPNEERPGEHKS